MERAEAIKIIKSATVYTPEEMEALETLIPELRESEDERIGNLIYCLIRDRSDNQKLLEHNGVSVDEALAYLEKLKESPKKELGKYSEEEELAYRLNWVMQDYYKAGKDDEEKEHRFKCYKLFWDALEDAEFFEQKEQKPELSSEEKEYVRQLKGLVSEFVRDKQPKDVTFYQKIWNWLNGINSELIPKEDEDEQKPAEWSEDYREEDIQTRFAFYTYKDDPSVLYLSNVFVEETSRNHGFGTRILKAAEKAAEAIGAITICLKVKQDSPANAWYRKRGYSYVAFEDGYDWLEKNLEYMKPNKQEWSEEDETIRHGIECLIVFALQDGSSIAPGCATTKEQALNWLKSLRPSWKPSEDEECKNSK